MRLTFLGAARMVTGSCYLLEAGGLRVLIDCGLFQGRDEAHNHEPFPFNPAGLDAVILTHAHIDHSGRLPLLCREGFRGPIYTHPASADLAEIMLLDSAHIQESDAERRNRKARRAGEDTEVPLYTQADAREVSKRFRPVPYGERAAIGDRLALRFQDAGHILGSAVVELFETGEESKETKIVFSGDIGQPNRPILRDPSPIADADYLVMESTYGDRLHESPSNTREALTSIIRSTVGKGGNLIIPAFAVGRTQEILYQLNQLVEEGQLPRNLKVVVDSPLAIAATEITARHADVYDEAASKLVSRGGLPFAFPGLAASATAAESKALNESREPKVIIAASGMCEAGRVVHHLKHNLWRDVSTVLFVGFQAEGTLGRRIAEGAKRVRLFGEDVAVRCRVESLHGFSAHADQAQLLEWVSNLKRPPLMTFLVHGEQEAQAALAQLLVDRGHRVEIPMLGEAVNLETVGATLRVVAPRRRRSKALVPGNRRSVKSPAKVALAKGASLALSSQRMSDLLRELRDLRKLWFANGPHLSADQAGELAQRADEVLRALDEMRRLMGQV